MLEKITTWKSANRFALFVLFFVGLIYISNAWSPSSYGYVLQLSEASKTGVLLGEPRAIRSDEWSVTTPLIQASVRNNFTRYNETSFYREDMRSNYSMPLLDWGLIFKPSFWSFWLLPAAHAYSFHYWILFASFIFGYANLFRIAGLSIFSGYLLSISLYFTGFVQFLWGSNASLFAYFPFLILAMQVTKKSWVNGLIFYWVATCWLIGNFYPPFIISLSLVAAVFIAAFMPSLLKRNLILVYSIATILACATTFFYLFDYLSATINTVYPGRRLSASGYYPWHIFLTQFWPSLLFDINFNARVGYTNIVGIGVAGLYWTLPVLCFINWSLKGLRSLWLDYAQRVLALGLLIAGGWMLAPIPDWIGSITLLNRVPPERMIYACGILILLNVINIVRLLGLTKNNLALRYILYLFFCCFGVIIYRIWSYPILNYYDYFMELLMPIGVGLAVFVSNRWKFNLATSLIIICTVANVIVFSRFNPIQDSKFIFRQQDNLLWHSFNENIDLEGNLVVQSKELMGATLNGMGFKSVAHLNITPQLKLWEKVIGPLDEDRVQILNRYSHVRLINSNELVLLEHDQIGIPVNFLRSSPRLHFSQTLPPLFKTGGGVVDEVVMDKKGLKILGWAKWEGIKSPRELLVVVKNVDLDLKTVSINDYERWDVVKATNDPKNLISGFLIEIPVLQHPGMLPKICVFSRAATHGEWRQLSSKDSVQYCP